MAHSLPFEFGVAGLWASRQEIVPPNIGVDARVPSVGSKDAHALGFAELAALVVEVLGCGQVLDLGPILPGADLGGGEDDSVESRLAIVRSSTISNTRGKYSRDVIFAHELIEGHIIWVLPPLFPVCTIWFSGIGVGFGD